HLVEVELMLNQVQNQARALSQGARLLAEGPGALQGASRADPLAGVRSLAE
ncbi:unnamed protein product, partial [Prorocentrum cordatum]